MCAILCNLHGPTRDGDAGADRGIETIPRPVRYEVAISHPMCGTEVVLNLGPVWLNNPPSGGFQQILFGG